MTIPGLNRAAGTTIDFSGLTGNLATSTAQVLFTSPPTLGPWATYPTHYKMPAHGKIRLTATYVYAAGATTKEGAPAVDPGPMAGVAPFSLTSAPLEFTR